MSALGAPRRLASTARSMWIAWSVASRGGGMPMACDKRDAYRARYFHRLVTFGRVDPPQQRGATGDRSLRDKGGMKATSMDGLRHPVVSVLIVAYQSREIIERCIQSVRTEQLAVEILLIDNGTDGTGDFVRARFPEVRVLSPEGNIGFGAGNNRLAAKARGDFLLLVNPDVVLDAGAIERLFAVSQNYPSADAWGGFTSGPCGEAGGSNGLILPEPADFLLAALGRTSVMVARSPSVTSADAWPVEALSGGLMMIRAETFAKLGGFDESFFLYSEEIDLFRRLREAGGTAVQCRDVLGVHDVGSGRALSAKRLLYRTTGQMHYARKHWPRLAWTTGAALWIMAVQRWLAGALLARVGIGRRARLTDLSAAWRPIAIAPQAWWAGYPAGRTGR